MQDPSQEPIPSPRSRVVTAAFVPVLAVILLWIIHGLSAAYEVSLVELGLLPRHSEGLIGILTAPLVHGDAGHLFNNSLPILVLGWCLVYFYPRVAWRVLLGIWLLTGIWVWISARGDRHIGASGVVYGMAAFLFVSGILRRQRALMAVSLLVVFLYGGLIWGVLPIVPRMSWESHLWGAVAGMALAFTHRRIPPAHLPEPVPVEQEETGSDMPAPITQVIYHFDPGDEMEAMPPLRSNDPEAWTLEFDPGNSSSTEVDDGPSWR